MRFFKYKDQNECLTTLFCPVFVTEDWKTKPGRKGAHYTLRPSGNNFDIWLYESIDSLNVPKKGKLLVAKYLRIFKRLDGFASLKGRKFFSPQDDHQYTATNAKAAYWATRVTQQIHGIRMLWMLEMQLSRTTSP